MSGRADISNTLDEPKLTRREAPDLDYWLLEFEVMTRVQAAPSPSGLRAAGAHRRARSSQHACRRKRAPWEGGRWARPCGREQCAPHRPSARFRRRASSRSGSRIRGEPQESTGTRKGRRARKQAGSAAARPRTRSQRRRHGRGGTANSGSGRTISSEVSPRSERLRTGSHRSRDALSVMEGLRQHCRGYTDLRLCGANDANRLHASASGRRSRCRCAFCRLPDIAVSGLLGSPEVATAADGADRGDRPTISGGWRVAGDGIVADGC